MSILQGEFFVAVLTLILFVYMFWPESDFSDQREKTRLDYLMERKDQLYDNLRNLNFGYHTGKYADEDFLQQQALLEIEVSKVMTEIIDLQKE
ncbi:MAG: hypothetical protein P4K86_05920 [Terracidiphilus sp.]|nr:hypothetical protein [Terracidiphilus sp.]